MGVETATYISQLVSSNPLVGDAVAQGANHLRLIKAVLQAQFPNFTAVALNSTEAQIDAAVATVTGSATGVMNAGAVGAPGLAVAGSTTTGLFSDAANTLSIGTNGVKAVKFGSDQSVAMQGNASVAGNETVTGTLGVTGATTLSSTLAVTGAISGGTGQLCLVGEPRMWMSDTLPSGSFGWLNGQAISRATYPVLFALWGTKYGIGDGSTTFNVPNFQEVVPIGKGAMGGASDPGLVTLSGITTLGSIIGSNVHTLAQGELPNVNFTVSGITLNDPGHAHLGDYAGSQGAGQAYVSGSKAGTSSGIESNTTGITISSQGHAASGGSGTAFNIVQPAIVVNWITLLG